MLPSVQKEWVDAERAIFDRHVEATYCKEMVDDEVKAELWRMWLDRAQLDVCRICGRAVPKNATRFCKLHRRFEEGGTS